MNPPLKHWKLDKIFYICLTIGPKKWEYYTMINIILYYNRYLPLLNIFFYTLNYFKVIKSNLFTCLFLSLIIIGHNELSLKEYRIFYLNIGIKPMYVYLSTFMINLIIFSIWERLQ